MGVSWRTAKQVGLVVYTIRPGKDLVGKACSFSGDRQPQAETLVFEKPLAALPPPREWRIGQTALVNYSGDEFWYTATIAKKDGLRYFICFDDEGWFWVDPSQIREDDIKPGDTVLAKLTKRPAYRPAKVTKRDGRMIEVEFEDGSKVTTTIHFIKVKSGG